MNKDTFIIILVMLAVFSATKTYNAHAEEHLNNLSIAECLAAHGYDKNAPLEERMRFDFSKSAGCASKKIAEAQEKKDQEQREFLKANPWYKGSNFNWTQNVEYTCEKIYSTQLMNTITVCSKPIYIN